MNQASCLHDAYIAHCCATLWHCLSIAKTYGSDMAKATGDVVCGRQSHMCLNSSGARSIALSDPAKSTTDNTSEKSDCTTIHTDRADTQQRHRQQHNILCYLVIIVRRAAVCHHGADLYNLLGIYDRAVKPGLPKLSHPALHTEDFRLVAVKPAGLFRIQQQLHRQLKAPAARVFPVSRSEACDCRHIASC